MVSSQPVGAEPQESLHPGWYADPWHVAQWRWWDGHMWTAYLNTAQTAHKPRLPSWLSIPVIIGLVVTVPAVLLTAYLQPLAVLLGLVPLLFVLPILAWLDRVEPEPRSSQIHAVLWGACVAALISGVVNTVAALSLGESFAAVVSAPLIEEFSKGLGIYWAVRRREVDGVMDGIVYAGWTALGFAVVENFLYFADASESGILIQVFVLRAIFTPFAHPLFTAWTGLAIGWAISRNKRVIPYAFGGFLVAASTHAFWNGSLVLSESMESEAALLVAVLCFVALFLASALAVILIRNNTQQQFVRAVPAIAQKYGISRAEVMIFGNWKQLLRTRRSLARKERKGFDEVHIALARLGSLHNRPGQLNPVAEQILIKQLQAAREGGYRTSYWR